MAEFESLKPQLTNDQYALIGAFYRLSQERRTEQGAPLPIKDRDIHYYQQSNGSCSYAEDLFITAIHSIDAEYIKQRYEEIRRKANKGK